ncbi:MAG TPA: hypothetical protein DIS74_06265 [Bacteroidales bacterium]|nr:hypothetical protein [Bacteroidales bacterium]
MSTASENKGKRILILGEYSGFSLNLKSGLKRNGCEVTVFTSGDSFKQLEYDRDDLYIRARDFSFLGLRLKGTRRIRDFFNLLKIQRFKQKNRAAFDLILVLNPDFLSAGYCFKGHFTVRDCERLLKTTGKFFLSACGVDIPYLRYGANMRYWPFSDHSPGSVNEMLAMLDENLFRELISEVDGVIPVMYDFAFPYRQLNGVLPVKIEKAIPLPLSTDSIRYEPVKAEGIIKILHGRSRDDFKGSDIIIKAMKNLREKYPDKVELILPGKLPLKDYLEVVRTADIVIDQCRSFSYAMNALFAMAMGKTVLSGNEPECSVELGFQSPVINILPDSTFIENTLESLVLDPIRIKAHGRAGRECIMKYHDAGVVASQYLSLLTNKEE